ncbi:uncharacterized protein TNCV_1210871 [Trichonephila clavipes]|uniref:Uncharacterized protein n=1 Tax=Trichonephila inaurata madagascariensis TaxID=2747483 RepID=A0A8X7BQH2_9ARAC|nr:uncharacterized protein TNCV_1210871 [Trichonephila clavipes]GFY40951.1 uncharacterized protein TNIN_365191 [Trichonephila inaurata madagascariensis]
MGQHSFPSLREGRRGRGAWALGIPRRVSGLVEKRELMTPGRAPEIKGRPWIGRASGKKEMEKEKFRVKRGYANDPCSLGEVEADFYFLRAC